MKYVIIYRVIQEERSVFWKVTVSRCKKKKRVHMNMCLIVNGYQDTAVSVSRPNPVRFLIAGLDEERSLQNKG